MIPAVVLVAGNVVFADGTLERGKAIYAAQCAKCHGNSGQGVATKYEKPLAGNSSVEQLAEVITDTMPEDDAGACVGEDAVAVASYIHGRFYNGTPRKKLARLTGTQLSQSLADLFSHFSVPYPQRHRQSTC